jgi:hypothetical protein
VHYLYKNENQQLGLENLEGMLKILPDANEVDELIIEKLTLAIHLKI